MIFFEPVGGLCNRMRAMASALALATAIECDLWLLWRRDATLNCSFVELFEKPERIAHIVPLNGLPAIRISDVLTSLFCDRRWDEQDVLQGLEDGFAFTAVGQCRRPLVRTSARFFEPAWFAAFRPVVALQETIDRYVASFDATIGVHLRRTDNSLARRSSPTGLFAAAMERELELNPATRFFLATDEPAEEALFQQRFGDRLIVHPKRSRRRDDPQAIRDAVVDLYCLAACRRIYGSYWSSFSETAQQLGSAELKILQFAACAGPS
jgi:hypothetical protein